MSFMKIRFFATPNDFRAWLEKNHATADELWVGFHKKATGLPSITWPESVDEALCFGWIDGVRRSLDATSYAIRFSPRRPVSTWSVVNIRRVEVLTAEGRMTDAGRRAFEARRAHRVGIYSYEQREHAIDDALFDRLRANKAAWMFWEGQRASYRKAAAWWVVSARTVATREKRLDILIADSAAGRRVAQMTSKKPAT
jgi:uncharacterized protein YdeI (YjbR/CyaY-like superfamily)